MDFLLTSDKETIGELKAEDLGANMHFLSKLEEWDDDTLINDVAQTIFEHAERRSGQDTYTQEQIDAIDAEFDARFGDLE